AKIKMQRAPHIAQILLPQRLIEAQGRHQLGLDVVGERHLVAVERASGNGVHHQEDDDRNDDEGDRHRNDATDDEPGHGVALSATMASTKWLPASATSCGSAVSRSGSATRSDAVIRGVRAVISSALRKVRRRRAAGSMTGTASSSDCV